jgi:hypothetical protein
MGDRVTNPGLPVHRRNSHSPPCRNAGRKPIDRCRDTARRWPHSAAHGDRGGAGNSRWPREAILFDLSKIDHSKLRNWVIVEP